jgi:hypothetical protein
VWPVARTVEPFDLKATAAVVTAMRQEVAGHRSRDGHTSSTSKACDGPLRRAAGPPPGWNGSGQPVEEASAWSPPPAVKSALVQAWTLAQKKQASRLQGNSAIQLLMNDIDEHAAEPGVIGAACARAAATRVLDKKASRDLGEALASLGPGFVEYAVDAMARRNGGETLSKADEALCNYVQRLARYGAIDPTRAVDITPAVRSLAPPAASTPLDVAPASKAAVPATPLPKAGPGLASASPASDDAEEAVGLVPPDGAATTQPSAARTSGGRKRPNRKRTGLNSRYAQRKKRRAAKAKQPESST